VANTDAGFSSNMSDAADRVADAAGQMRQKAAEVGQQAAAAIDSKRQRAAGGLESTAQKLHESAEQLPGGEGVRRFAHRTADTLGATAGYVRSHSVRDMVDDATDFVKDHPGQALLGAVALGFFAGWMMRRS
jgi:ElaB/YqjD/DUF883 family membrane-anchored ribosome-binding protein